MKPELIFAMDGEWPRVVNIAVQLYNELGVRWVKIGPQNIDKLLGLLHLRDFPLPELKIFLDLKLADTADTCEKAARRYRERGIAAVSTFTDAATNGAMRGAWNGTYYSTLVWRVNRLTDEDARVELPQLWGHGIICPGVDLPSYIKWMSVARVVPGIRRAGKDDVHNHGSPTTPSQAVACGATHLVVGRPIYEAADPGAEARDILREMGV